MKKLFAVIFALQLIILPVPKAHAMVGMEQITGIAIAAVGVGLVGACKPMTPSIMLYVAGAAVYLIGEMTGGKEQKQSLEESNAEMEQLKQAKEQGGEVQLASLEAQLKDKKEKLKLAKKRKAWAAASSAMMLAAAALAAAELIPIPLLSACEPGTALALGKTSSAAVLAGYTFLSGGGIMGALTAAILGMVVAQSAIASLFSTPIGRAAGMAVSGGLVMMASRSAGSQVRKLEGEIEDLEKVIAQFRRETDGTGPNREDTTAGASGGVTSGTLAGVTAGAAGGSTSGATSGSSGGVGVTPLPDARRVSGPSTCLSSAGELSTNCTSPMRFSTPNLSLLGSQPEIQQVASQGIQFANDAASGNTERANLAAATLSGAASRMNDALKKTVAQTNQRLRAQGKKPIDLEKEKQDVLKSIQSSFDKQMAGKEQSLASIGFGKLSLDPEKAGTSGLETQAASADSAVAVPTSAGPAAQALDSSAGVGTTDATTGANANDATKVSAADALGKNLSDYETPESDISKKSEDSLWKQVSNRYFLNYDRFFEKKKVPAQ